ncbi:MAG: 16S rRNA (uracil(1498)-N(3))-methyltransferase [Oscillospiraceae bacterium]|nr:16S rRNA (uracil(1498)-N(3))-methyltransferase [Oscillospiraceae bacterium]
MRRFFWDGSQKDGLVELTGSEARHIHSVLRLKPGDGVILCDGGGNDYSAELIRCDAGAAVLTLLGRLDKTNEPACEVCVYLAYTKGDRLEYAVQKTVELGASAIYMFESERCVTHYSENKLARLSRIAFEACKQSGRGKLVGVFHAGDMAAALLHDRRRSLKLFCFERSRNSIRERLASPPGPVCVMCGPEGGFTDAEAIFASKTGWLPVSLGKRVLRSETAPVTALSIVLYEARDI